MPDDSIPRSILLVTLVLCGGFFAGSETAFSYCNRIRMKRKADEGNRSAMRVLKILDNFDKTLATLLIAINVIYVSASAIATVLAVEIFGAIGSLIATVVMTIIIFLFSETIPKNIARTNSDAFAVAVSLPISFLVALLTPLTAIFAGLGNALKKLLKIDKQEPSITEDEFCTIIDNIEEEGILEPEERSLIQSAVEFSDTTASDIMVKIEDVVGIDINNADLKQTILDEKYSRLPVYEKSRDNIIGILNVKNVIYRLMDGENIDIRKNMRIPVMIDPQAKINDLFETLTRRRTHIAVVINEAGAAIGIVTMEDILEELVGEIYDEDDNVKLSETEASA